MEGLSSFDRESRRIALVWAAIGLLVLLGFFAHSAVSRGRYRQGQRIWARVLSHESHRRRQDEYKLVEANAPPHSPASYVMPEASLFYNHETDDVIEVFVIPGSIYAQSADDLEYWSGRSEVNWVLALMVVTMAAMAWSWFKTPLRA